MKLKYHTLRLWNQNKNDILAEAATNGKRKRFRTSSCVELEKAILEAYEAMLDLGIPVNQKILALRASEIINKLKEAFPLDSGDERAVKLPSTDDAIASFVNRLCRRQGISLKPLLGEELSSNYEEASLWASSVFPEILLSVDGDESRILNMDETALFWRMLPSKSLLKRVKLTSPRIKLY